MDVPELSSTAEAPARAASANGAAGQRRFDGKIVLLTGVSDRGIGGAVAERLSGEGASVAVVSRSEPQRVMARLKRLPQSSAFIECDVTCSDDVRRAIAMCQDEFGRVDVLINNAGVELAKPLDKMTDEDCRSLLDVNLNGAIAMSRAVLPLLPEQGGVIVNVASALGLAGCPGFSVYSASKAGLIGFTQSLAWELAPRRVRVVAVAPALVDTPMTRKHIEHLTAETWNQLQAVHPLGIGSTHDVAAAIAFLASHDARWITGVTLPLGWGPTYPLPTESFLTM